MTDFAARIARAEFRRVFQEPPLADAHPDNRTLADAAREAGTDWLSLQRDCWMAAKEAGNHEIAAQWAAACPDTLIRHLGRAG